MQRPDMTGMTQTVGIRCGTVLQVSSCIRIMFVMQRLDMLLSNPKRLHQVRLIFVT